ncbi:FkbM family methyltransferase [Cohnella sp.]|uniref:FkbM family methyltransferase n=1 Tax=Cohnella sp. TaxID=1883426 RepID=UPI00356AF45D
MGLNAISIGQNRVLCLTGHGSRLLLPANDLSLTPEIVFSGGMEFPLTHYFLNHVRPGHRVIDIGANIGYYSVLLGRLIGPEGKLWAYEPYPELRGFLFDNLSINYVHDRTVVLAKAAYSSEARLTLNAPLRYMGNCSIRQPTEEYRRHYADEFKEIVVDAEALDSRADEFGTIDFAKMDIEGGEYHALRGMERLLPDKVRRLVFELNRSMLADDWEPFCDLLRRYSRDYGKRFSLLSSEGLPVPVDLEDLLAMTGYPYVLMHD